MPGSAGTRGSAGRAQQSELGSTRRAVFRCSAEVDVQTDVAYLVCREACSRAPLQKDLWNLLGKVWRLWPAEGFRSDPVPSDDSIDFF
jgi:hypothetical protein